MHYEGSCHCGRIAFAFESAEPIASAVSCNCSICRRRGSLLWFGPRSGFELRTDPAQLESYRFNSGHIDHHHCRVHDHHCCACLDRELGGWGARSAACACFFGLAAPFLQRTRMPSSPSPSSPCPALPPRPRRHPLPPGPRLR